VLEKVALGRTSHDKGLNVTTNSLRSTVYGANRSTRLNPEAGPVLIAPDRDQLPSL
jgi:hypothetical protein